MGAGVRLRRVGGTRCAPRPVLLSGERPLLFTLSAVRHRQGAQASMVIPPPADNLPSTLISPLRQTPPPLAVRTGEILLKS